MEKPNIHGKYMPSTLVLQCLADYCLDQGNGLAADGTSSIRCVTELKVNNLHLRANPVQKDGAWFDNVVLKKGPDDDDIILTLVGCIKFMFFFPGNPNNYFCVLYPAYDFQPSYSVLTHMYRMKCADDPPDILESPNHVNNREVCWLLDDNCETLAACPHLTVEHLSSVQSHLLMIPYHDHSKFMIGVTDQSLWCDKFVSY